MDVTRCFECVYRVAYGHCRLAVITLCDHVSILFVCWGGGDEEVVKSDLYYYYTMFFKQFQ